MGVAQPGAERHAWHDPVRRLAERRIAVLPQTCASIGAIAVEQVSRDGDRCRSGAAGAADQIARGGRTVDADRSPGDRLPEEIKSRDIAEALLAVRGEAEFLAELILARGDVLGDLHWNAGVIAIIRGVPIPETPCADRGERADAAEIPVGDRRDAAFVSIDAQLRIDVSQPVVGIRARRGIAELRGEPGWPGILPRGGA